MAKRRSSGWLTREIGGMPMWGLAAALVVLAGLGGIAISANSAPSPTATWKPYTQPTATVSPLPEQQRVSLPNAGAPVVFFGDSWTEGIDATPRTDGYAYLVGADNGWQTTVLGQGGTGYLNPGSSGITYGDRSSKLAVDPEVQLVILQGSINDTAIDPYKYPDISIAQLGGAVRSVVEDLRDAYPSAQIVAVGPTPNTLGVPAVLQNVSNVLGATFAEIGVPYISTLDWVTPQNVTQIFNGSDDAHLNSAGHRYFADQLESALGALTSQ